MILMGFFLLFPTPALGPDSSPLFSSLGKLYSFRPTGATPLPLLALALSLT